MRRRNVVLAFAAPVLVGAAGISFRLSQRTTSVARRCLVHVPGINGQPGFDANLPCTPLKFDAVTSTAPWRWPLLIGLCSLSAIGLVVAWTLVPRMTSRPAATDGPPAPLVGRARGGRTKYRLAHGSRWCAVAFALAGFGGGGTLLLLPTGAPALICWMFIGFGALMAVMSNVGSIIATDTDLSVRLLFHRKRWVWEQIEKVAAADTQMGVAKVRRRMLTVHLRNGRTFASQSLTSSAWGTRHSRVDRLAAALERHRVGHVGGSLATRPPGRTH